MKALFLGLAPLLLVDMVVWWHISKTMSVVWLITLCWAAAKAQEN